MGGRALGYEALRVDAVQYNFILKDIDEWFESNIDCAFILGVIPAYESKPSFGDADIVVRCTPANWEYMIGILSKRFEHYKNGKTFSFGWKTTYSETPFQVDLIYSGDEDMDFNAMIDYFSYNDCGNLVGRLAHRCGFKYGHDGLKYVMRDPLNYSNVISEVSLSKNTRFIHEFLDLDHDEFLDGFETLESMFEWVSRSRYFNPEIYLLDNVNAISRIRDRKRKTYMYFLEWCEKNTFNQRNITREQIGILRTYKLAEVLDSDWNKCIEFNSHNLKHQKYLLAKQFFNGDIVRELTGLSGKPLGEFMKNFKPTPDFVIENMNQIEAIVLNEFERIKNENQSSQA